MVLLSWTLLLLTQEERCCGNQEGVALQSQELSCLLGGGRRWLLLLSLRSRFGQGNTSGSGRLEAWPYQFCCCSLFVWLLC